MPLRIVDVLVDHRRHRRAREVPRDVLRVAAVAERQQLHEQTVVRALRLPTFGPPFSLRSGGSIRALPVGALSLVAWRLLMRPLYQDRTVEPCVPAVI